VSGCGRLVITIYRALLSFYPAAFRNEFGEEMRGVFTRSVLEAAERGGWAVTAVYVRELRQMPLNLVREYWHSLTKKELPMALIKKPEWSFYPTWIILTLLCIPIAFFIDLVIMKVTSSIIGDFIYVNGVRHITEDYLSMYAFVPIVGLLTGLMQYGLLRRYLPHMGWWVLATTGGWFLGLLLILTSSWLNIWTFETINLDLAFIVMGLSIGVGQWLLLRRRLPRAGWWVGANVLGWALLGLITGDSMNQFGLLALGFLPACVTAVMIALLINWAPPAEPQGL
jgi:hypothetical protein